ncbi:MAG: hypothetical protein JXB47_21145 [Anaerolineae bacterium]|nr:hypothetical protein [Anaerolineae bacterium]
MFGQIWKLLSSALRAGVTDKTFLFTFGISAGLGGAALLIVLLNTMLPLPLPLVLLVMSCVAAPVFICLAAYHGVKSASGILEGWFGADEAAAYDLVLGHIFGAARPKVRAAKGKLSTVPPNPDEPALSLDVYFKLVDMGIPTILLLEADSAALTEMHGSPHRIYHEAGAHELAPFERIREVFDLRNRRAALKEVSAFTIDSIKLVIRGEVEFKINWLAREMSIQNPYPVDPDALLRAAYKRPVDKPGGEPSKLDDMVSGIVASAVRDVIAQYHFSEIFERSLLKEQTGHSEEKERKEVSLEELGRQVAEAAMARAQSQGVTINLVTLEPEIPKEVEAQAQAILTRVREQRAEMARGFDEAKIVRNLITTVIQTLEESGYKDRPLDEIVRMIEDTVLLKRNIDFLIGEEEFPPVSPLTSDDPKAAAEAQRKKEQIQRKARSAWTEPSSDTDVIMDKVLASKFRGARTE